MILKCPQEEQMNNMTTEKAIYQLTDLIKDRESFCHRDDFDDMFLQDIEACKMGIQALEKQIPKKPIHKTTRSVIQGFELDDDCIYCPLCNKFIGNLSAEYDFNRISTYCSDCGQALDWSDESET